MKPPFETVLTEAEIAACEKFLLARIVQSVRELPSRGDAGKLSAFMDDLRALSLVVPTRPVQEPQEQKLTPAQMAATDDSLLQKQNALTSRKESAQAVLTEVRGLPDDVVEKMTDAEVTAAAKPKRKS